MVIFESTAARVGESSRRSCRSAADEAVGVELSPGDSAADCCELDPDERSRFLDEACGDDAELRAEVESLLAVLRAAESARRDLVE